MNYPPIQLLVTDLDNTLYDWLAFFVPSFYAMVRAAVPLLGLTEEEILSEFKIVNSAYGDTEKPFALLDLPSTQRRYGFLTVSEQKEKLDDAFHEFNRVRHETLVLYDGVSETLSRIRDSGALIVAHTDAQVDNALFRMKKLSLTDTISRLYAPMSNTAKANNVFANDYVVALPGRDRKPNPRVLLDICEHHQVDPAHTLYVGDSLLRDISMANHAGTRSAFAEYGAHYSPTLWKQLVRVTHWSPDTANQAISAKVTPTQPVPDFVLSSFPQLLQKFSFSR
jgi:phosphoglycolate phosphatase-like HAD superfamily hydrolase